MGLLVLIIIIVLAFQMVNINYEDAPTNVISRLHDSIINNRISNIKVIKSENDFETILEVSKNKNMFGIANEEHIVNAIHKEDVFKNIDFNNNLKIVSDFSKEYFILAVNKKLPIYSMANFSNHTNLRLGIQEYSELLFFDIANQHDIYLGTRESNNYVINLIYTIYDKQSLLKNNELDVIFMTKHEYETLNLDNYNMIDIPYINTLPKFIHKENTKIYKKIMLFTNNL